MSFTDVDITLHFIVMDIFADNDEQFSVKEIVRKVDGYLEAYEEPKNFDESTIRKKLKEYEKEGIVKGSKQGKVVYYSRTEDAV